MIPFLFLAAGMAGAFFGLRRSQLRDTSAVAAFAAYRAGLCRAVGDEPEVVYVRGKFCDPSPTPRGGRRG